LSLTVKGRGGRGGSSRWDKGAAGANSAVTKQGKECAVSKGEEAPVPHQKRDSSGGGGGRGQKVTRKSIQKGKGKTPAANAVRGKKKGKPPATHCEGNSAQPSPRVSRRKRKKEKKKKDEPDHKTGTYHL